MIYKFSNKHEPAVLLRPGLKNLPSAELVASDGSGDGHVEGFGGGVGVAGE